MPFRLHYLTVIIFVCLIFFFFHFFKKRNSRGEATLSKGAHFLSKKKKEKKQKNSNPYRLKPLSQHAWILSKKKERKKKTFKSVSKGGGGKMALKLKLCTHKHSVKGLSLSVLPSVLPSPASPPPLRVLLSFPNSRCVDFFFMFSFFFRFAPIEKMRSSYTVRTPTSEKGIHQTAQTLNSRKGVLVLR